MQGSHHAGRARPALNISDQNWQAADHHPDYYSQPYLA